MSQAFFAALEAVPEATRSAVAKAAQAMIRDELKSRREKEKASAAKEKARRPVAAKREPRAAPPKTDDLAAAAPAKRRSRKQAGIAA